MLNAAPWFERVPSGGNPADAPSRLDRARLAQEVPSAWWLERPFDEARLHEIVRGLGGVTAR